MPEALPAPGTEEIAHSASLSAALREEIAAGGPMPFARFMERCLYAPGLGYYSAGRTKFGAGGDFITAPELGDMFARCMAMAMQPTLAALGSEALVLELGGGSGAFAEDLLQALARADTLPARYLILEPSADLKLRQRERLDANLAPELRRLVDWIDRPPEQEWHGILFANEVIDALPATRFAMLQGEVHEEHVVADGDSRLTRVDRPTDSLVRGAVRHLEADLGVRLEDGYRSEVLPQLPYWMQAVAGSLVRGAMWFVDYGYPRREYYHPQRSDGTLIAHYRHRAHGDPLWYPGLQDLSASVDFTALAEAGNSAGFELASYLPQSHLLVAAGLEQAYVEALVESTDDAAAYALSQQVKRLSLPGEMGERFQAMLLVRGLPPEALPAKILAASQGARL